MKKGNPKSKSEDQISVIQNIEKLFGLREKIIDFFFVIILFYYLK